MKKLLIQPRLSVSIGLIILLLIGGCKKDTLNTNQDDFSKESANPAIMEVTCEDMNFSTTSITLEEEEMIIHMREEEKLARDVYLFLYGMYNMNIFNNIASSEQTHMDKVLCLLIHFNMEDPASTELGVFNNPNIQELYNDLILLGSSSKLYAMIVGATIEDLDIYDLEEYIDATSNADIIKVFSSLCCGSRNHLRSFNDQLVKRDYTYTPQYISQEYFDLIVNTEREDCGSGREIMNTIMHRHRNRTGQ